MVVNVQANSSAQQRKKKLQPERNEDNITGDVPLQQIVVKNPYVRVFGQPIEISLVEGGRAKKEITVFGVDSRQVEGNVETVLTDTSFFPVQMFDTKTDIHGSSDRTIDVILSTVQESCTITYIPGIEKIYKYLMG